MRINVYAEELTNRTEVVRKHVEDAGVTFYGVRLYLGFPFIHREGDDDSSAITLWVPWTKKNGHDFEAVKRVLHDLIGRVTEAEEGES